MDKWVYRFFGETAAYRHIHRVYLLIVHKLIYPATPLGYSSLMAVLLFVGGMIMMMLGMVGEYIGRIYVSLNNAPQYVIRRTVNIGENKDDKDNG